MEVGRSTEDLFFWALARSLPVGVGLFLVLAEAIQVFVTLVGVAAPEGSVLLEALSAGLVATGRSSLCPSLTYCGFPVYPPTDTDA